MNDNYPSIHWFEDFEEGQRFHYGQWIMDKERMLSFARLYDPEPFHLAEDEAVKLGWDGLIASGLQILSIWRRLSKDAFPNCRTVISPGWDNIRWLLPVYAGDTLHAETHIATTRVLNSRPGEGLVRLDNTLFRQDKKVICRLLSNWFVRKRPETPR